jgi:P27 family predicted phage terminase small subunit
MRGRKPKPTIKSTLEGNPGKRPQNGREPTPSAGIPRCPKHLDDEAKAEWFRTAKVLKGMGLFTLADRTALAAYCTAYSRWVEAERMVKKFGMVVKTPEKGFPMKSPWLCIAEQSLETMRKLMVEFGLTPSSRSRIRVPDHSGEIDELDAFLKVV